VRLMRKAGHIFEHEEEVLEGTIGAPQIFLRPREADREPVAQFHDVDAVERAGDRRFSAGPDAAPLTTRAMACAQVRYLAAATAVVLPPSPVTSAVRFVTSCAAVRGWQVASVIPARAACLAPAIIASRPRLQAI
jgi:quercetin 2,3-dioxygenase